jgi:hypothetical protein
MALSDTQKSQIQQTIATCLRYELQNYETKSNFMPFHFRLLGKDRMSLHSFIYSLLTNFGTSIFEPVTLSLASITFKKAKTQTNELKVADEFWDFLGGQGTYLQLLDIFERIGIELRPEIDDYFVRYNR